MRSPPSPHGLVMSPMQIACSATSMIEGVGSPSREIRRKSSSLKYPQNLFVEMMGVSIDMIHEIFVLCISHWSSGPAISASHLLEMKNGEPTPSRNVLWVICTPFPHFYAVLITCTVN